MTKEERSLIVDLQKQGFGYRTIAAKLGLNLHSVKSYCARHPINKNQKYCLQCGVPVEKLPHKKEKKFCSDKCRFAWWREHKDEMTRRSVTKLFCPVFLLDKALAFKIGTIRFVSYDDLRTG